jgi:Mrp family chromosome partitioning ATPase
MPSPQDPAGLNVLPMFKGFVALQVQLLKSPTATHMAIETEVWRERNQGRSVDDFESFAERRAVVYEADGQHIQVFFTDPSPDVAQAGVQALIRAYTKLSADQDTNAASLENATTQAKLLEGLLKEDAAKVLELTAAQGGVEGLAMRHRASVARELAVEEELEKLRGLLRTQETAGAEPVAVPPRSAREIAVESAHMAQDLLALELLEAEEARKSKLLGAEHEELVALRQQIEIRKRRRDEFVDDWNRVHGAAAAAGSTVEDLKVREQALAAHRERLRQESRALGQIQVDIDRIRMESADRTRRLEKMNALKDQLTAQLQVRGRISTPTEIERPAAPYRDRRRMTAVTAGVVGGGLGVLIVLLFGLADRRMRTTGDVSQSLSSLRLLGLMPEFTVDLRDPRGGEIAAHCVHQIRTMLQIGHARDRGACVSITGPGVGSGKTTLSLALGLSFGHASSRTLLVDADLTGHGLTHRVEQMLLAHARQLADALPSRSGEPAVEAAPPGKGGPGGGGGAPPGRGSSTPSPSRELLASLVPQHNAARRGEPRELVELLQGALQRCGERTVRTSGLVEAVFALCDLRFRGKGRDELEACLRRAAEAEAGGPAPSAGIPPRMELSVQHPGFNGVGLERFLFPTGVGSLSFLPLRGLGRAGSVSVATLAGILERLRSEFEVTLVDTGPVPGAVEAPIVAAQADAVVLVVSPDDHRPDAERAVAHLEEVGAHLAGVVFNRAGARDVLDANRSQSSTPPHEDAP